MFLIFSGVVLLMSVSITKARVLHNTESVSYHNPGTEKASHHINSYHHREKRQITNLFGLTNPWIQSLAKRFNDFIAPVKNSFSLQNGQGLGSQLSAMLNGLSRTVNAIMIDYSRLNNLQDRILEWRKRANDAVNNYLKRIGFTDN